MDLNKIYYDGEGNKCNILQLVKRESEWAANRIQEGEKIDCIKDDIREIKRSIIKICDALEMQTKILAKVIEILTP